MQQVKHSKINTKVSDASNGKDDVLHEPKDLLVLLNNLQAQGDIASQAGPALRKAISALAEFIKNNDKNKVYDKTAMAAMLTEYEELKEKKIEWLDEFLAAQKSASLRSFKKRLKKLL